MAWKSMDSHGRPGISMFSVLSAPEWRRTVFWVFCRDATSCVILSSRRVSFFHIHPKQASSGQPSISIDSHEKTIEFHGYPMVDLGKTCIDIMASLLGTGLADIISLARCWIICSHLCSRREYSLMYPHVYFLTFQARACINISIFA